MLLPSDVARLVLGYLQQENLTSTCQTFILESSNLKEYAEHCTDEGFIPACLLSLFGKNLTTILNEYVAMKAKETSNDVPTIMSSLWKKLDHTLSQIRSMQSSPGFAAHQRARTRNGIAEIKRQRWLASQAAPVSSELLVLPYASGQFTTSPLIATQAIKPAGQVSAPVRSNIVVVNQSQPQNTVTNTAGESLNVVPGPQERKTQSSLMSPGRRKSESQKKSFTSSGPHSSRNFQDPNAFTVEKQMVIENAREKILSNKSLQEKLAENINKFLTSDSSTAQVPKQTDSNPTEPETSIDELLGLPSEIHMSEEAIQDILEQTESDPAFQALFDLFDYGKTKNNKNISQMSSQPMETNPNIVLPEETNLTIKSSFETEESDGQSGQPPFCTSYQNEDVLLNDLKSGNSHDVLPQESQENFSQISSNIQKQTFKTAVPAGQKCALDITFESVSNLSDFNQRASSTECNEHCSELYTSQMPTEAEVAVGEKNSLSPDVLSQSQYQPDGPSVPVTSFVSLGGETNDKNLVLSGKNSQLLSQSTPLTTKPSKSQFCENSNNVVKVTTNSQASASPDSSETHNNKIETNSVSQVASQPQPDCQVNSPLQSKTSPVVVEGLGVNVTEKVEIHFEEAAPSDKQSSNDSASVDLSSTESKTEPLQSANTQEPPPSVKDGDAIFLSLNGHNSCEKATLVPGEDAELNSAVSSISGENLPTIILSSKSPAKNAEFVTCLSSEETASTVVSVEVGDSGSIEQNLLVLKPEEPMVNNTQNEDGVAFSANVAPCVPKDGGYIQLMPATSTAFGNSSNILIATCMTDSTALGPTVSQSNVVVLPGSSAPMTAQPPPQQLQTPPKSNSAFAVSQAVSPNFSQGSAIIIASPVQPVLQGMVGMIPVSVVGQNGNTFSTPPQQVLHMPLAAPVCNRSITQLPIPQKSQKAQGLRNKPIAGRQVNNLTNLSSLSEACHTQRTEVSDKNIATELGKKIEDTTIPLSGERLAPASKPFESHRRVLCFDSTVSSVANTQGALYKMTSQNKEKKETPFPHLDSPILSSTLKTSPNNAIKREREKTVPKILSKSETASSRHTTVKEVQSEKKVSPTEMALESFHKATANKENELCSDGERPKNPDTSKLPGGQQNGSLRNEKAIASLQELTKKQATPSNNKTTTSVGGSSKDQKQEQSKSPSSLIGVEILQDVPLHSPVNRIADTDLPVPRTPGSGAGEKHKEEASDSMKAPASRRCGGEEGNVPRVMIPPVTADLPACSPASETGSENSVSMAAHTLMILSRAAIARTTATPLKDNMQQFRTSSRSTTKKRKIEELDECERNSRTSGKNLANSSVPMKKKKIKKKKLPSSFPAGMDVDKFLLSLHYDE
ncbi:protein NPAT isoform X2 [Mastomys coucha]|uniref:protein NPAT isoform X2 n=1 Tax=Mastomys coucha TaxID=35658 RepID=UPI001261EC9F|nr:protein NPAT isoform X2 [Mastomys coucha]